MYRKRREADEVPGPAYDGGMTVTRREALAALASAAALPLMTGCGRKETTVPSASTDADALALLDDVADNLLRLLPESATSLGIDTGARAALRSQLADRSAEGQQRLATQVRADLERVNAFDTAGLSHATRTSVEVVRSAYATALEGFALPYGDITVGGWRNTPYVVIQNVGAYLDIPRFLDSDHRIENAADAEAYLARLQSYAKQLDGELGRMQAARARRARAAGVPDRQGARADDALGRRTRARAGRSSSRSSGGRRTFPATGPSARGRSRRRRSRRRSSGSSRELQAQRAVATDDAGISARPHGEEFYRWALKASTTTTHVAGRGPRDGPAASCSGCTRRWTRS